MSLGERVFAGMYDRMIAGTEKACLASHRQALIGGTEGEVIEIGGGTGANLVYYGDGARVTVIEPSGPMIGRLQRRIDERMPAAKVVQAAAEELPFADESFDVAVSTLVLCSVEDQARAIGELRRVLRPGGRLLFIEHVRSEEPRLARWQDRMNGLNRLVARCNCNRATVDAIDGAGFSIERLERGSLAKAPPFVRPLAVGVAKA